MRLTFIGMSNAGKTHWSKKLERSGFRRFCCDDMIEKKLAPVLLSQGYAGIQDVARWLGQPYDTQYKRNSALYLEKETESLKEIIAYILAADPEESFVVDTTGSVIYTKDSIMKELARLTTIVYFDTPASVQDEMYKRYVSEPKPVYWGNSFRRRNGEPAAQTIARCYPELLAYRTNTYKKYAHATIGYSPLREPEISTNDFLALVYRNTVHSERIVL